jgi:hypothetical protein
MTEIPKMKSYKQLYNNNFFLYPFEIILFNSQPDKPKFKTKCFKPNFFTLFWHQG